MTPAQTIKQTPRSLDAAQDDLDRDALNLFALTTGASVGFFGRRDYDAAESKLKAALAIIERVKSRRRA